MKKLIKITIITMAVLSLAAPMVNADACTRNESSSFHSIIWGHNGNESFTSHSMQHQRANARVWTAAQGGQTITAPGNGATARASRTGAATANHYHRVW